MSRELVRKIVEAEWEMFDQVNGGSGQRASCQEDSKTFYIMRSSQALAWTEELQESYWQDLLNAKAAGRNLLTEKYARMMESTDPIAFERIRGRLPDVEEETLAKIEEIVSVHLRWKLETFRKFPHLTAHGRSFYTRDDTKYNTSFETYLRGELRTYSAATIDLYQKMVQELVATGENLEQKYLLETVRQYGYDSLEQAESLN
ncbi:MAG: DUF4125 family protein [Mogibacterium sp.]|nr:DUF4125 family protein [Mogibacterium sp.]